jgi:hypothetical protein
LHFPKKQSKYHLLKVTVATLQTGIPITQKAIYSKRQKTGNVVKKQNLPVLGV